MNQIFARSGLPQSLVSDKGTQFINETVETCCKVLGLPHTATTAHSKEEYGPVERANKEDMRHLRAFILII